MEVLECGIVLLPWPWWAVCRDSMTELMMCDVGLLAFCSHVYMWLSSQGLCFYLQRGSGICVSKLLLNLGFPQNSKGLERQSEYKYSCDLHLVIQTADWLTQQLLKK